VQKMERAASQIAAQASTLRPVLVRIAMAAAIIFLCSVLSRAGGPKRVAGTSYFDPSTTGQPVLWPQGQLTYYTDQGDLSPYLPASSADAFVADAFSQWTAVSTAALSAANAGHPPRIELTPIVEARIAIRLVII